MHNTSHDEILGEYWGLYLGNTGDFTDGILVVDDEFIILRALCLQLEDIGLTVCATAATANEAVSQAEQHRPKVVLMDLRLKGDLDGVDAALRIRDSVGSKMIFVTGSREPEAIARIGLADPAAILFKPVSEAKLRQAIEQALT